jgi:nicotinamide-nucleotide amidase
MQTLIPLAEAVAARLKQRGETVAVSETSTGGLISTALLAVPGASAYFLGGAVVYTRVRSGLLGMALPRDAPRHSIVVQKCRSVSTNNMRSRVRAKHRGSRARITGAPVARSPPEACDVKLCITS